MTDSVNAGADDVKRANCGSKLEQWRVMQESGCHVATLGQPIQKSTIKNVMTSQCRDVSTRSVPHHLKHQWFRNQGIGRRTNEGTEFQSNSDTDFEEVTVICTVSHFWILK